MIQWDSIEPYRLLGTPSVYQSTLEMTPTSYKDHCKRLFYLVEKQRELCGLSQNVLTVSPTIIHPSSNVPIVSSKSIKVSLLVLIFIDYDLLTYLLMNQNVGT